MGKPQLGFHTRNGCCLKRFAFSRHCSNITDRQLRKKTCRRFLCFLCFKHCSRSEEENCSYCQGYSRTGFVAQPSTKNSLLQIQTNWLWLPCPYCSSTAANRTMQANVETSGRPLILGILLFLMVDRLVKKHMAKLKENDLAKPRVMLFV